MTEIDIRQYTGRPDKGSIIKTTQSRLVFHPSTGWVAYRVGSSNGWYVFNRLRKTGALGSRWVVGYSMTFQVAISCARKHYNVKVPNKNWESISIKHYNLTDVTQDNILNYLLNKIKDQ